MPILTVVFFLIYFCPQLASSSSPENKLYIKYLFETKQFEKTKEELNKIEDLDQDEDLLTYKGLTLFYLKDFVGADQTFSSIIKLNPNKRSLLYYRILANIYYGNKEDLSNLLENFSGSSYKECDIALFNFYFRNFHSDQNKNPSTNLASLKPKCRYLLNSIAAVERIKEKIDIKKDVFLLENLKKFNSSNKEHILTSPENMATLSQISSIYNDADQTKNAKYADRFFVHSFNGASFDKNGFYAHENFTPLNNFFFSQIVGMRLNPLNVANISPFVHFKISAPFSNMQTANPSVYADGGLSVKKALFRNYLLDLNLKALAAYAGLFNPVLKPYSIQNSIDLWFYLNFVSGIANINLGFQFFSVNYPLRENPDSMFPFFVRSEYSNQTFAPFLKVHFLKEYFFNFGASGFLAQSNFKQFSLNVPQISYNFFVSFKSQKIQLNLFFDQIKSDYNSILFDESLFFINTLSKYGISNEFEIENFLSLSLKGGFSNILGSKKAFLGPFFELGFVSSI